MLRRVRRSGPPLPVGSVRLGVGESTTAPASRLLTTWPPSTPTTSPHRGKPPPSPTQTARKEHAATQPDRIITRINPDDVPRHEPHPAGVEGNPDPYRRRPGRR